MIVTEKTKLKEVQRYLTDANFNRIMDAVDERPIRKDVWSLSCGEFIQILNEDSDFIEKKVIGRSRYALEWFGKYKTYKQQMDAVSSYLRMNETKPTEEEKAAMQGVKFPTLQEQIMLEVQARFGLKSFDDVGDVPLSQYLLIVKEKSANLKFEKNLNKIYDRKRKEKSK